MKRTKFAERLKFVREEAGLSQRDLAKILGVRQCTISRWEIGLREPSIFILIKIAKYFSVTANFLLGIDK